MILLSYPNAPASRFSTVYSFAWKLLFTPSFLSVFSGRPTLTLLSPPPSTPHRKEGGGNLPNIGLLSLSQAAPSTFCHPQLPVKCVVDPLPASFPSPPLTSRETCFLHCSPRSSATLLLLRCSRNSHFVQIKLSIGSYLGLEVKQTLKNGRRWR